MFKNDICSKKFNNENSLKFLSIIIIFSISNMNFSAIFTRNFELPGQNIYLFILNFRKPSTKNKPGKEITKRTVSKLITYK